MTPVAATRAVERRFGDLRAVDRVTFEVRSGEIVGLLGANGAGKTTLIRMLLGLLGPSGGSVSLFGKSITPDARRRVGYLPQGGGLYGDLTVGENLAFTAGVFGAAVPAKGDLGAVWDVPVARIPLGLKRRVGFAAAVSHGPDLLVLDEPTSGVGPLARSELWDRIHAATDGGAGVLVTTHYMDEAEQCDRLVVLAAGREVASGTVQEIVGSTSTVVVRTSAPAAAATLLERAGLVVLPAGDTLRLPGADPAAVRTLLDRLTFEDDVVAATLEEAFIVLSAPAAG